MPHRLFWRILAAILVAAVLIAAAAAAVYRAPLLEAALEVYLADRGYPQAGLEITEFTSERIVAEDVSLGPGAPSAARIVADSYLKLFRNEDRWRLEIDSLRVPVDATKTGGPGIAARLAYVAGLLHEYRDWLPILDLSDLKVTVRGAGGTELTLAGGVITRVDWPSFGFAVNGEVTGPGTQATVDFRTGGSAELPGMRLDVKGTSDLAKLPWPQGTLAPAAGTATFTIESLLPIPTLVETFGDAFARFDGTASLDLKLDAVSLPDRAEGLSATVSLKAEGTPESIRIDLPVPAEVSAASLALPELSALGTAGSELAALFARNPKLTVAAKDGQAPAVVLSRSGNGWRQDVRAKANLAAGTSTAALVLDGPVRSDLFLRPQELETARVELEATAIPLGAAGLDKLAWRATAKAARGRFDVAGPLQTVVSGLPGLENNGLSYSGSLKASGTLQDFTVLQEKPGRLALSGKPRFGDVTLDGPVEARITAARLARTSASTHASLAAHPDELNGKILRGAELPAPFTAKADAVRLDATLAEKLTGEIALENAAVSLPAAEVEIADIAARLPFAPGADAEAGSLTAVIRSLADPAPFEPIEADLGLTQTKDAYTADGRLTLAGGKAETPLTARYEPETKTGEMRIGPADYAFEPDGLQPADLNPALAAVRKAEGAMRFDGKFAFAPGSGLQSSGRVAFEDFTFETPDVRIEDLDGALEFLDLLELRTARDQLLTAEHVIAGASLDDVAVDFSLAVDDSGTIVDVDEASAHIADGDLDVPATTVRFADAANAATVHVKSVSLARLLEGLGTDNVTGTGTLSGTIPVRFGTAGFAVENAELKAESGGTLHVRLGSAKETLEAQGEAMRLMVRALEDFRYELLEIGIDRRPGEDLSLRVKLEGMNPDVLDGHPFRFNINLTGDVEPLLAALKAGQGLTADILERAVDVDR